MFAGSLQETAARPPHFVRVNQYQKHFFSQPKTPMLRTATRRFATAAAASSSSNPVHAASSILSYSTPEVLPPGSIVVNLGAETEIGQTITVGAAMRGLTTINVVSQGSDSGYPDSVSHVYALGGDYVVTESFLGFRGFEELVNEVCGEGNSPSLVINGSSMIEAGTNALAPFAKAKTFTAKKSAIEDMQDNNTLASANRVGLLSSVVGSATMVTHGSYSTKGNEDQTAVAKELMEDLSSIMVMDDE